MTKTKIVNIIRKLSKTNKNYQAQYGFNKAGNCVLTDGYRIIQINTNKFELCLDDIFSTDEKEKRFKQTDSANILEYIGAYRSFSCEIKLNIEDIKSFIETAKNKYEAYVIETDDFKIGFNPEFLIDGHEVTKSNILKIGKNAIFPAIIEADNQDIQYMVLPIRIN